MKPTLSMLLACALIGSSLTTAFAQGPLVPTGPPAATMKTLDQIEPRTPIDATHTPGDANNVFIITKPGSYYLTTNVDLGLAPTGISITTNDVTIDLCGFSVIGHGNGSSGIINSDVSTFGLTVRNGIIRDCGFGGVVSSGSDGRFEDLTLRNDGSVGITAAYSAVQITRCVCRTFSVGAFLVGANSAIRDSLAYGNFTGDSVGFQLGDNCSCTGCIAQNCSFGITSGYNTTISRCNISGAGFGMVLNPYNVVTDCSISFCSSDGITVNGFGCQITGCSINRTRTGIVSSDNATINNCDTALNSNCGISAGLGCVLSACTAHGNTGYGIVTSNNATIISCTSSENSSNGIVVGQGCTITGCTMNKNGNGTNGIGLVTDFRATIVNCSADQNQNDGLRVNGDSSVTGTHASFNGRGVVSAGIRATGGGSRIDTCQARDNNGYGIFTTGFDIVTRNFSGNSATNYFPATGGTIAPILTPATATNALANF